MASEPQMDQQMTQSQYALEWSKKQNCFHIHPLSEAVHAATTTFMIDGGNDYRIIHVGPKEECHQRADALRGFLQERAIAKKMSVVL